MVSRLIEMDYERYSDTLLPLPSSVEPLRMSIGHSQWTLCTLYLAKQNIRKYPQKKRRRKGRDDTIYTDIHILKERRNSGVPYMGSSTFEEESPDNCEYDHHIEECTIREELS